MWFFPLYAWKILSYKTFVLLQFATIWIQLAYELIATIGALRNSSHPRSCHPCWRLRNSLMESLLSYRSVLLLASTIPVCLLFTEKGRWATLKANQLFDYCFLLELTVIWNHHMMVLLLLLWVLSKKFEDEHPYRYPFVDDLLAETKTCGEQGEKLRQ